MNYPLPSYGSCHPGHGCLRRSHNHYPEMRFGIPHHYFYHARSGSCAHLVVKLLPWGVKCQSAVHFVVTGWCFFLFGELTVMASFGVGLGLESLLVLLVLARRARVASGVGGWIGGILVKSV